MIFSKKFSIGENINSHINEFDKFCEEQNIKDSIQCSEMLIKSLEEDASLELQAMPEFKSNRSNYQWLKTKLLELYHIKSTKVTPIINILILKQEDMTLRQYLTAIRVAGVREMPDDDEGEREKTLVSIFLKGVNNRLAARATEIMKPKTLEEAFNLMKKEDKSRYNDKLRIINNDFNTERWQETEMLKRRINELENRIIDLERSRETKYSKLPVTKIRQETKCFNCNEKGHIARNCKKPLICKNCNKSGHISRFCKLTKRPVANKEAVRKFEEINENSNVEYDEASNEDERESEDSNDLFKIITKKRKVCKKKDYGKSVNYPDDIVKIDEYIRGVRQKFPAQRDQRTMISNSRSEPAANKPIIKGKVEQIEEKIFLDSGAESSIMDLKLFQTIRSKEGAKLFRSNKTLTCANGSPIKVIGYSFINVNIGNKINKIKMTIVDKLFPRIRIGIMNMKK